MDYIESINQLLLPMQTRQPLVVDLFAGCGGLSLGFEAQGFETHGFEMDASCCTTYRANLRGACTQVVLTPETVLPPATVVIGGPPCQPFSVGGKQMGLRDSRDGFPTFVAAVARLQPAIWLFENVRGVFYRNKTYLEEVIETLRGLGYTVDVKMMNAVAYGVPQNRERVVVVGHDGSFTFPHSDPKRPKVTAGEALGDLATSTPPESKYLTTSMDAYIARYEKASACKRPRDLHLKQPSRTLTCRNLAGATGDMLRVRLPDGRRRRLLLEEAARLQSFPDWFTFYGSEASRFNQVGNAVPPLFAYHLAASVRKYLELNRHDSPQEVGRSNPFIQLRLLETV